MTLGPYIGEDSNPDWGGRLRTVLHAPYKRDRIPKQLRRDILRLMDEVRVGLGKEEAKERLNKLIQELDPGLFVALRPFWCEMLVTALATGDLTLVEELTRLLARGADVIDLTGEPTAAAHRALQFGLQASWMQALAQAVSVATGPADRDALLDRVPELDVGQGKSLKTKRVIEYAMRIRRHKLVPNSMVAVPLAEFTDWEGRLIGANAFTDFIEWCREAKTSRSASYLAEAVSKAVRFIHLHETCLAVHLWAGESKADWLDDAFSILAGQPLIQPDHVAESRVVAESVRTARCTGSR